MENPYETRIHSIRKAHAYGAAHQVGRHRPRRLTARCRQYTRRRPNVCTRRRTGETRRSHVRGHHRRLVSPPITVVTVSPIRCRAAEPGTAHSRGAVPFWNKLIILISWRVRAAIRRVFHHVLVLPKAGPVRGHLAVSDTDRHLCR